MRVESGLRSVDIEAALVALKSDITDAKEYFYRWELTDDDHYKPSWIIESCFLQILAISEALGLSNLQKIILTEYKQIKRAQDGFLRTKMGPEEPYSEILTRVDVFLSAIESFFPTEGKGKVTRDLDHILRDVHYVIADESIYEHKPRSEKDVHLRIEGILKCIFKDLKHKPILVKPIKNFEPDTGIPSIKTLIEYKFISRPTDIRAIADQVLADTRGYVSKDWDQFLYIIYETRRFKRESEWKDLLHQSGVPKSTSVIVLGGEMPPTGQRGKKRNKKRG